MEWVYLMIEQKDNLVWRDEYNTIDINGADFVFDLNSIRNLIRWIYQAYEKKGLTDDRFYYMCREKIVPQFRQILITRELLDDKIKLFLDMFLSFEDIQNDTQPFISLFDEKVRINSIHDYFILTRFQIKCDWEACIPYLDHIHEAHPSMHEFYIAIANHPTILPHKRLRNKSSRN